MKVGQYYYFCQDFPSFLPHLGVCLQFINLILTSLFVFRSYLGESSSSIPDWFSKVYFDSIFPVLSVSAMCCEIKEAGRPVSSNYMGTFENQNYLGVEIPTVPQKSEGRGINSSLDNCLNLVKRMKILFMFSGSHFLPFKYEVTL